MKRISVILLSALIIAGSLIVIYRHHRTESSGLTTVTINQAFEHPLYIGLYVAQDAGFFKQQGLDVRIETGGGDAQAFSALTSGKADFAQGDPAFVAIANQQGWDGRVIAMAVDRVATWGVTFDKSITPFTDPHQFRNRTVATYPDPNTSYVVQKQLDQRAGLILGKTATILQVPFGTELATLHNHQADIAQTVEPNVSQAVSQGGTVVFSYPDAWGPLAFTGVMTSKKLIDTNPDLVQRFVTAYEQGLRYVHDNPAGTLVIAQKRLPNIDPKVLESALKRLSDSQSIPQHAVVNPESWNKLLQIRIDVGDLKQMPTENLVDNQFALKSIK